MPGPAYGFAAARYEADGDLMGQAAPADHAQHSQFCPCSQEMEEGRVTRTNPVESSGMVRRLSLPRKLGLSSTGTPRSAAAAEVPLLLALFALLLLLPLLPLPPLPPPTTATPGNGCCC